MIRTVQDLRRALDAYAGDMPVVSTGIDGFGSSFLTVEEDDEPIELELFGGKSKVKLEAWAASITGTYLRIAGDWSADDSDLCEPVDQIETLQTIIRDLHVIMRREGWQA